MNFTTILRKNTPRTARLPDLITCVVPVEKYDVTDENLFPLFPEDLKKIEIDAQEMIGNVSSGKEFFLYTCLIKADFWELKKLLQSSRRFKGVIENEYKLFDVYVVKIENWDNQLEVKKVVIEFDEFSEKILYEPLPLWNIRPITIKANAYPQPAIDRKYYEHYLYAKQFDEGREYLLRRTDYVIRNIRRQAGDWYIICDSDAPGDWEFYEFAPAPNPKNYENPLLSNEQNASFSRNMIEYFGQRIKTRTKMVRFLKSFKCSESLSYVEAKVSSKPRIIETYSTEKFIEYEYRMGNRAQFLELAFRPQDEDFYLNRDLMSFLVTEVQHFFPEYQCVVKLV